MNAADEKNICANCSRKTDFLGERAFRINAISGCGHKFCSSCIDQGFRTSEEFKCRRCQNAVRREQLSSKELEQVEYERDREKRLQYKKIFNKTQADFSSIEDFQDYEEMVEDIIYALVKKESVEKVNEALAKIKKYQEEDPTAIRRNYARQQEMERLIDEEIKQEELIKIQKDEDYYRRHVEEIEQQGKIRKFQDAFALGDSDPSLKPTKKETTIANQDAGWSQLAFLNQRPEPQPIASSSLTGAGATKNDIPSTSEENKRRRISAGGYDFLSRDKRGWNEIHRFLNQTN